MSWPTRLVSAAGRAAATCRGLAPGLAVVAAAVAVAFAISHIVAALSALLVALVLGVLARNAGWLGTRTDQGLAWSARTMLRAGVVLLGFQLSVPQLLEIDVAGLLVIVGTAAVTFAGTLWFGIRLGLRPAGAVLMATGFSICGASAVAAMASVTDADEEDVATAIALVTLFGSIAIATFPVIGSGLGAHEYGIWIGASVHEVAQVVAAATVAGETALLVAVVAKLGRVVLLAPMVATVGVYHRIRNKPSTGGGRPPLVPVFVLGFLAAIAVRSTGMLPEVVVEASALLATLVLAGAMFGLGCGVRVRSLLRAGRRAGVVGAVATALAATVSYVALLVL